MARSNRRRARNRPAGDRSRTGGSGQARSTESQHDGASSLSGDDDLEGAPDPLEHATPDAELAQAQLALGRPELADVPTEAELEEAEEATEPAGGLERRRHAAPARHERESLGRRMVGFLRGSWAELQRVQWPDRRQVAQATGVVLGFVVVAGVYLGVASVVAQKIVNLILYGHG